MAEYNPYNVKDIDKEINQYRNTFDDNFNINKLKSSFLPDAGVILSYGEGRDFVPAGIFYADDFVDIDGNHLEDTTNSSELFIKFVEYTLNEVTGEPEKKPGGEVICVPYSEWKKIDYHLSSKNTAEVDLTMGDYGMTDLKTMTKFHQFVEEIFRDKPDAKPLEDIEFHSVPLEKVQADYYSKDHTRGANYSLIPFSFPSVLEKCNTLSMNIKDLGEEGLATVAYFLYSEYKKNNPKAVEQEIELGRQI